MSTISAQTLAPEFSPDRRGGGSVSATTERADAKTPLLVLSFHEPDSCGGFNWAIDTPENRAHMVSAAQREAESYRDVILIAAEVNLAGLTPADVTDLLDAELVFESGRVGKVLYRSPAWADAGEVYA